MLMRSGDFVAVLTLDSGSSGPHLTPVHLTFVATSSVTSVLWAVWMIVTTASMSDRSVRAHWTAISVVDAVLFARSELKVVEVRTVFAFDFVAQSPVVDLRAIRNGTARRSVSSAIHTPSCVLLLSDHVRNETA